MNNELFEKLKASWPSPLVARSEVSRFSGGLLNSRTMANLDAKGEGPGKIPFGRNKVAYSRDDLIDWMINRIRM